MATAPKPPHDAGATAIRSVRLSLRRQRADRRNASLAINLAPMIDVTFLLLIFFLVTTTFDRAEGLLTSKLPDEGAAPAVALPLSPIVVRLETSGGGEDDYTISIDKVATRPANDTELVDVLLRLQQQPGFDADTPVVIIAQSEVRWDHVVACWNAALRAGCKRIAFGEP